MGFSNKCTLWDPVFWPLTSKNCVGVSQIFFWPIFLDVFFDVDSGDKKGFDFRPSGAEISPFFWFWSAQIVPYSVIFSKNRNFFFKSPWNMAYFVQNFLLIIFMKSILVHLVPPTHRIAKTAEKSAKIALLWTQISRDWDRNRKNPTIKISAYFRWF